MINVKIEITTEAGDQVVDINQRCKEARLAEVLKSALAAFEGTDDSELGKLVLKTEVNVDAAALSTAIDRDINRLRERLIK